MNNNLSVDISGQGPDLVLLHGWGMHSEVWQPLLPFLEASYTIYRVDLPGHGNSRCMPVATTDEQQANLTLWLQALLAVTPSHAIWLGWSLGGLLALAMAQHYAVRVNKLILLASSAKFVAGEAWPHAMPVADMQQFRQRLADDPLATLEYFIRLQTLGGQQSRPQLRTLKHLLATRAVANEQALRTGLQLLQGLDLRAALAAVECPSLLLLGEHDPLVPAAVAADMAVINPQLQSYTLPDCGHLPQLGQPAALAEQINTWCKRR